jgi:hypothetical protein
MKHGYTTSIPMSLLNLDLMNDLTMNYISGSEFALNMATSVLVRLEDTVEDLQNAEDQEDLSNAQADCEAALEALAAELSNLKDEPFNILEGKNPAELALGFFQHNWQEPDFIKRKVMESVRVLDRINSNQNPLEILMNQNEMCMNELWPLIRKPSEKVIRDCILDLNVGFFGSEDEDVYFIYLTGGGMDMSFDLAFAYALVDGSVPTNMNLERPEDFIQAAQSEGVEAARKVFEPDL